MKRQLLCVAVAALALSSAVVLPADGASTLARGGKGSSCAPSPKPLRAAAAPVPGLSAAQVTTAVTLINSGARLHVPQRGQTLAVMTALRESSLRSGLPDSFYTGLLRVKGWENLPPTLAAHAVQHNLDPQAFTRSWPQAEQVMTKLTSGTGIAGLQNLAARAQQVADCEAATLKGRFAVSSLDQHVGPLPQALLVARARDLALHSGGIWFDRCQAFVAILDGRQYSGYSTALDAWQTFQAEGVAHPVTGVDGVAPPPGAWLYYASSNPAGHVATYLGDGKVASTDVFSQGHVGIGPASALTDGPWHLQYLGWAPPWGQA